MGSSIFTATSCLKVASTTSSALPKSHTTRIQMDKNFSVGCDKPAHVYLLGFLPTRQQLIQSYWIWSICVSIWEELLVLNTRSIFCWFLYFVDLYFLLVLKKTLRHHNLESLPQPLIAPTPQVNQDLPCWHNCQEKERGKSGQDQDRGGDFCHSEGQRDRWEDQEDKNQKDEEGAGLMDVNQYGVDVPNNRGVH